MKLSYFKKSIIFLFVAILLIVIYFMAVKTSGAVASTADLSSDFISKSRYFRWAFIALVAIFWKGIVSTFSAYKKISDERKEYAEGLRWRVVIYLVALEILIIEGLPSRLLLGG